MVQPHFWRWNPEQGYLREKEILHLLIGGHNNKQIGDRLFLSELTIKTHRKNIMKKMDAHNPADLLQKSKGPSSKFWNLFR